jgi:hypothetical protein
LTQQGQMREPVVHSRNTEQCTDWPQSWRRAVRRSWYPPGLVLIVSTLTISELRIQKP